MKKITIIILIIIIWFVGVSGILQNPGKDSNTIVTVLTVLFVCFVWWLVKKIGSENGFQNSLHAQPPNWGAEQGTDYRNRWYRFKRGFYYDRKGYPRWRNTNRLVHRTVVANEFGGKIPSGFVVHHKDENKSNFRKDNLVLMTRSEHARLHLRERMRRWWY